MDILTYFIFFSIIILIIFCLFFVYIKIRFPFWALQPVYHIYDLKYLIFPKGIINEDLPEKNKFTNFKNIKTQELKEIPDFKINNFIAFIQNHFFIHKKDKFFFPKKENILPYFKGHNQKIFFSFYFKQELVNDLKNELIIDHEKCVGVMMSRPIHVSILKNNNIHFLNVYYVDYLCVHENFRKQNIAPEIIQTHEYFQRHKNKNIQVSIFKREGILTGIIPLTIFNTYGFSVKKWIKPPDLPSYYTILEITEKNISLLFDFLKNQQRKGIFDIMIQSEISNIIELIKTNNIFIYCILLKDQIIYAYFFRKSCVLIEKDLEILTCIGSINSLYLKEDSHFLNIFIHGFKCCFWNISYKHHFGYAAIENISHNYLIINNLIKKTKPDIISPTAYFFYNFAYPTFSSKKTFILL